MEMDSISGKYADFNLDSPWKIFGLIPGKIDEYSYHFFSIHSQQLSQPKTHIYNRKHIAKLNEN